jgi:hypothetical protein
MARLMALVRDLGSVDCSRTEALRRLLGKPPAAPHKKTEEEKEQKGDTPGR